MRWEMLTKLIGVIISQYMKVKSLCCTHDTYTVWDNSYISIKVGGKLWGSWMGDALRSEAIQEGYLEKEEFQVDLKGGLVLD